ncbi:Protein brambleberry [Geodia barretti]|nr:Protein brambleberry [Geodia barretti]
MMELSEQQAEVKNLAQSSLKTLQEAQREAKVREREIAANEEGMKEKIASNLEHLAREKVLISSGQQLIANMTSDIRQQLEVASEMLGSQEQNLKASQKEIMDDISTVRENIQGVWGRIDNRTSQLLGVLQDITDHYQDTLESLRVINETLGGVQEMVEGMNAAVHTQLDWVIGQLGGANHGLRVLSSCAGHALFLLVAMLVIVFLRAPAVARFFLLVSVVTNAVCDVRMGVALTYSALATMATIVVLLNWLCVSLKRNRKTAPPVFSLPNSQPYVHTHSDRAPFEQDHAHNHSLASSLDEDSIIEYEVEKPANGRASRDLTPQFLAAETLSSTPSKALSGPARCVAMTNSGMQCRLRSIPGSVTCHRHC